MANLTTVGLTAGAGSSGTGTVSTLDNVIGTAGTPSANVQTVQGVTSMTPLKVDGSGVTQPVSVASLPSQAVTNAGTFAVQVTSAPTTAVTLATLPAGTNALGSVTVSNANANGRALPANSAPVVLNSMSYKAVAASATATLFGTTGATGDYLDGVLVIPATAAAGTVSITDGSGSAISIFAGGGTTALPTLAPFYVPIGAISSGGTGGWKVTTGTNVSVIGVGNFT